MRPTRALRVTIKSQTKRSWIFSPGFPKSVLVHSKVPPEVNNHASLCNRVTGEMRGSGRMAELARSLRKGQLIGGSDASVTHGKGSAAWKIAAPTNMITHMQGEGQIDGDPRTLHSTRVERGATVGCLWAIMKLAKNTI